MRLTLAVFFALSIALASSQQAHVRKDMGMGTGSETGTGSEMGTGMGMDTEESEEMGTGMGMDTEEDEEETQEEGGEVVVGPETSSEEEAAPEPQDGLLCTEAEPQSPRDISPGTPGYLTPRVQLVSAEKLIHVNTHFHDRAEHRSEGEFDIEEEGNCGFLCATDHLTEEELAPYDFQYCEGVEVGHTYEVHWVTSSHGVRMGPGLGGAFARGKNPIVHVTGQVVVVVNNDAFATTDFVSNPLPMEAVTSYLGSTTGKSYDNTYCSPFNVFWSVDPKCHMIHAASFDEMCRALAMDHDAAQDVSPGGSRALVDANFVVTPSAMTHQFFAV
jgi:hypothetical protein